MVLPCPPEVDNDFFCLFNIQDKVVWHTPAHQMVHLPSVGQEKVKQPVAWKVLRPRGSSLLLRCCGMMALNSKEKSTNSIRTCVFLFSRCSRLR